MRLLGPVDMTTRPITDRVKESLFGIISARLEGARVADLFCGTGSLGLEALSRGAASAVMVDRNRKTLDRLRQNITKLCLEDRVRVVQRDIFRYGWPGKRDAGEEGEYDVVFVDPPYADTRETSEESPVGKLLAAVSGQVREGGLVVVRHEKGEELLGSYGELVRSDRREYGRMVLEFLEKSSGRAAN